MGVSGGSRPSDKRGGSHPVPEKKGGGQFPKKTFSAPVWSKNKGEGGTRAPPLDPLLGGFYKRQFTVVN